MLRNGLRVKNFPGNWPGKLLGRFCGLRKGLSVSAVDSPTVEALGAPFLGAPHKAPGAAVTCPLRRSRGFFYGGKVARPAVQDSSMNGAGTCHARPAEL